METQKFSIASRYSEFQTFYKNLLSDSHGIHVQPYTYHPREYTFQHTFLGVLIVCKVIVIDTKNLDLEISIEGTPSENSEIHANYIIEEIKKQFFPAQLPDGFKNLISENEYAGIMEQRWRESEKTQQAEAWLATVVILGSILEGILLYKIKKNQELSNRAYMVIKSVSTPKPFNEWTLETMIDVCHRCGWITKDAKAFSNGVKEYRNFVHPWKQLENHLNMPTETTCKLSRDVIEIILNDLWK